MTRKTIIILAVLICLIMPIKIEAALVDSDSIVGSVGNKCTKDACWPVLPGSTDYDSVKGMRVSLISTAGDKRKVTANIIWDNKNYNWLINNSGYVAWSGDCSKVEYLYGKCNLSKGVKGVDGASPYERLLAVSSVNSAFSKFGINISSALKDWSLSDIWNKLSDNSVNLDDVNNDNPMVQLMNVLFGVTADEIKNMDVADIWIVVEPLTVIIYKGQTYLGTHYELSSLGYGGGISKSAINSVIGRRMPCAAMSTGNIYELDKNTPGASPGYYFNNHLAFAQLNGSGASLDGSNTISTVCAYTKGGSGSQVLNDSIVSGGYGVGISLIRFPFKAKPSCADIESSMPQLKNILEPALNALPEKLKFTKNGQQYEVDREWYKAECTCYGVYNEYKAKTGIYLPNLDQRKIQTIFSDNVLIFSSYVQGLKTKYEKTSNVTMWDYAKYERLKCKYTVNRCTDVSFSDIPLEKVSAEQSCSVYLNGWRESYLYSDYMNRYGYIPNWALGNFNYRFRNCMGWGGYGSDTPDNRYIKNTCYSLPLFPNSGFNNESIKHNQTEYNTCFNYYNKAKGTSWNLSSYMADGCNPKPVPPKKYDCTPKYGIGTCLTGENVNYNDNSGLLSEDEYWKNCVFSDENSMYKINPHKYSNKNQTFTYYDKNISGKYCEVYCIENFAANFDSNTITVLAGSRFTWNNHVVSGSRTCKTKEVKYDRFLADLKQANQIILDNYAQWKAEEKANRQTYSGSRDCGSCCLQWTTVHKTCRDPDGGRYDCSYDYCSSCGIMYSPSDATNSFSASSSTTLGTLYTTKNAPLGSVCNERPTSPYYNTGSSQATYESSKELPVRVIEDMQSCYNVGPKKKWEQYIYLVNPKASVEYTDGYYKYQANLVPETNYTNPTNKKDCVGDSQSVVTTCSGTSCSTRLQSMEKCKVYEMSKGATTKFTLKNGVFEYIIKDTHLSVHKNKFEELKSQYASRGETLNYFYLGYSNFPVAYSSPDGMYGEGFDKGKLSLEYAGLGYNLTPYSAGNPNDVEEYQKPMTVTDVDKILKQVNNIYGDWKCKYQVTSELIPDSNNPNGGDPGGSGGSKKRGDIDVIFRPIDLANPFPDKDASGRTTGSNWCEGARDMISCNNKNAVVTNYITNNRNVKEEEVYKKDPMYTFILTPAIVNEIRRYNDDNPYEDYTGNLSGKTFDYKCNPGKGRTCISDYLSELITLTNAKNEPGTCTKDTSRNYRDNGSFEACRKE